MASVGRFEAEKARKRGDASTKPTRALQTASETTITGGFEMGIPEPWEQYEAHTRKQNEQRERYMLDAGCDTCNYFYDCVDGEYGKKACDDYEEAE